MDSAIFLPCDPHVEEPKENAEGRTDHSARAHSSHTATHTWKKGLEFFSRYWLMKQNLVGGRYSQLHVLENEEKTKKWRNIDVSQKSSVIELLFLVFENIVKLQQKIIQKSPKSRDQ